MLQPRRGLPRLMRTRGVNDKLENMDDSIRGWTRDVGLISGGKLEAMLEGYRNVLISFRWLTFEDSAT